MRPGGHGSVSLASDDNDDNGDNGDNEDLPEDVRE